MTLSEISIRRPVFATVLCLLLVFVGLMCLTRLGVREFPRTEQPVVSIQTTYRGASAAIVETKITQPLEDAVAGIEGIEKLTSSSSDEMSRINIEFTLDRSIDEAANDVRDRISRLAAALPDDADPPQIAKMDSNAAPVVFLSLSSTEMTVMELTDYVERYLLDRYSAIPGVASAVMQGQRRQAMRIWIDRQALAARQLTVEDIEAALRRENIELPAGRIESTDREFTLRTDTRLNSEQDFRELAIRRGADGYLVRLGEVADVRVAAENERTATRYRGSPGVTIMITQQSTANALTVSEGASKLTDEIAATLPEHMTLRVLTNNGAFIRASLNEVVLALVFSLICVLIVIYAFIGSWRATLIPALTIPVSIIASAIFMYAMGYSINVLTLLAMVLAIGLVVDDAIVVLENIHRRIEMGEPGVIASIRGSREIGFAVIATTLVLVTVFVPLSFLTGAVGRLFVEFGFTLAASILFSCLVALTLVPMMSSKLFANGMHRGRVTEVIDTTFKSIASRYAEMLRRLLPKSLWVLAGTVLVMGIAALMFRTLKTEAVPSQDAGYLGVQIVGPDGASFEYMDRIVAQIERRIETMPGNEELDRVYSTVPSGFGTTALNRANINVGLVDYKDRARSSQQVASDIQRMLADTPGVRVMANPGGRGGFGASSTQAVFVLQGPEYQTLGQWRDKVMPLLQQNPGFTSVDVDYQERKPQMLVQLDRNRAADLGVSIQTLGRTLETVLGARNVTTFVREGREYNVILQGRAGDRASPDDLRNLYIRSDSTGDLIPVANMATLVETAGATELRRFNRLRSVTFTTRLAEGYTQGQAVDFMRELVAKELPINAGLSFDGATREYMQSSQELYWTFAWALLLVFLVLAAQFESYVNATVILATVPLAVIGAIVGLFLMGVTINIYSQIAIVMLIGLAAKNGVLIVEFANQLRDSGKDYREAIIEASATRLRPVLMTSFCAAFGAIPLFFAHGAGAETRHPVGVVVIFGVTVSMVLTLFVVPAVYALIARSARTPDFVSRMIDGVLAKEPPAKPAPTTVD